MKTLGTTFLAAFALLAGSAASAQTTGSLTLSSQPADYIGGGQLWQYDDTSAALSVSSDGSLIGANVFPVDGGWWTVQLAAPPGQPMTIGTYENALRAVFRPAGSPGIDVSGMGRGCNQTYGRFVVTEATFGPNHYVERFSATFEQRCESPDAPPLYGEIRLQNPPPPPALALGLSISEARLDKVTGAATLRGTLTCNKPANALAGVTLTQRVSRTQVVRGWSSLSVPCESPGKAVELVVSESSGQSFVRGRPAEISASLSGFDPDYGSWVSITSTQVLKLR